MKDFNCFLVGVLEHPFVMGPAAPKPSRSRSVISAPPTMDETSTVRDQRPKVPHGKKSWFLTTCLAYINSVQLILRRKRWHPTGTHESRYIRGDLRVFVMKEIARKWPSKWWYAPRYFIHQKYVCAYPQAHDVAHCQPFWRRCVALRMRNQEKSTRQEVPRGVSAHAKEHIASDL